MEDDPRPRLGAVPNPGEVSDVDLHLGRRIRDCRRKRGMSQQQLGNLVGITYQQTHKYERGLSRIPAGRLYAFARALQVPTSWFFEGLEEPTDAGALDQHQRSWLELSRSFASIESEEVREALSHLARLLAEHSARNHPDQPSNDDGKPRSADEA